MAKIGTYENFLCVGSTHFDHVVDLNSTDYILIIP